MQPFSIQCETCSARLKVKNASAIGQRLACPKCGGMVLVEPPDGWQADDSATAGEPGKVDVPQQPRPTAAQAQGAEPLLPGEQWTSSGTQQRRKWLLLAAGIIAILALSAAVVFAFIANRNKPDDPSKIVQDGAPGTQPIQSGSEDDASDDGSPDQNSGSVDSTAGKVEEPQKPDFEPESESDPETAADESNVDATSEPEQVVVAPPPEQSGVPDENAADQETATEPENVVNDPLAGSMFDDLLKETNIATGQVETNFGELSDALENSGASLAEFGDLAAVNERGKVGQKKYFIFKPDRLDPTKYDGLNLALEGIQYNDQSLLTVLAEFFEITGVPVTLDADLLNDAGFAFSYRTRDFKVTRTTFAEVLQKLVDEMTPDDATKFELQYNGAAPAKITIVGRNARQPVQLPLPAVAADNDKANQDMVELIKHLTGSDAWEENSGASLVLDGDAMTVVNNSRVVAMVRKFVTLWNRAVEVTSGELDAAELRPLWLKSQAARDTAFDWSAMHDTPILQFLAAVQQSTKVNVIVNWDRLLEVDWNPRAEVPPDLNEANVGDMLDELTHSMGLAYRVVNPDTFEITTEDDVNEQPELEFFSCHAILQGDLNEKQVVDIVRNAVRSTGQNLSAWRVVFEPRVKCFIAVGPQTLHRQIHAILNRIETLNR